jgi:hypothetical protein
VVGVAVERVSSLLGSDTGLALLEERLGRTVCPTVATDGSSCPLWLTALAAALAELPATSLCQDGHATLVSLRDANHHTTLPCKYDAASATPPQPHWDRRENRTTSDINGMLRWFRSVSINCACGTTPHPRGLKDQEEEEESCPASDRTSAGCPCRVCRGCGANLDHIYIDSLPAEDEVGHCHDIVHNYETLWRSIERYTPPEGFTSRGVTWATAFALCYPDTTTPDPLPPDRVFSLLAELLACTRDGHVELEDSEGRCFSALPVRGNDDGVGGTETSSSATAADRWALHCKWMPRMADEWASHLAVEQIDGGKWEGQSKLMIVPDDHWLAGHPVLSWGWLKGYRGGTAYLMIAAMDCADWEEAEAASTPQSKGYPTEDYRQSCCRTTSLHPAVAAALDIDLDRFFRMAATATAVVVDVRLNEGGEDSFSRRIASRFADAEHTAYRKVARETYTPGASRYASEAAVTSQGAVQCFTIGPPADATTLQWCGPTMLMVSETTGSAAEVFALAMNALPYVHSAGCHTAGMLSDMMEPLTPCGWRFALSHEAYYTPDDVCVEGKGVSVDHELTAPLTDTEHLHAWAHHKSGIS